MDLMKVKVTSSVLFVIILMNYYWKKMNIFQIEMLSSFYWTNMESP